MIHFRSIESAQAYATRLSSIQGMSYAVIRSGSYWAVMLASSTMGRPVAFRTLGKVA